MSAAHAALAPAGGTTMDHWKRLIEGGNQHFREGRWVEAREAYLQALAWAQMLFERWHDVDEAGAALVVSYHNLADLHLRLGQAEEGAEYLGSCHDRLQRAARDAELAPELRASAQRHGRRAYVELLHFIARHDVQPSGATSLVPAGGRAVHGKRMPNRQYH